ncbi:MAG: hypothetical protein IPH48_06805 [bacterium]|nr:hypothetical protein [bacterium]
MKKRVFKTRSLFGALLQAVVLIVAGSGAPAVARENISVGQAGDPGDGDGVTATTGSSTLDGSHSGSADSAHGDSRSVVLVPIVVGGHVTFLVLVVLNYCISRK